MPRAPVPQLRFPNAAIAFPKRALRRGPSAIPQKAGNVCRKPPGPVAKFFRQSSARHLISVFSFCIPLRVLSAVEGLFEADQLPEQRVVARVGVAALLPEQAIEPKLGVFRQHDRRPQRPRPEQARRTDGYQTGGNRATARQGVGQTFANKVFARQSRQQVG